MPTFEEKMQAYLQDQGAFQPERGETGLPIESKQTGAWPTVEDEAAELALKPSLGESPQDISGLQEYVANDAAETFGTNGDTSKLGNMQEDGSRANTGETDVLPTGEPADPDFLAYQQAVADGSWPPPGTPAKFRADPADQRLDLVREARAEVEK